MGFNIGSFAGIAIGGLGAIGALVAGRQISETRRVFAQELAATRATVKEAVHDAAVAIPGGMWNLELDKLWGNDPKQKKDAQEWFTNIIGKRPPEGGYAWQIYVTSKAKEPLKGRVFPVSSADPSMVRAFLQASPDFKDLLTSTYRPMTDTEVNAELDKLLTRVAVINRAGENAAGLPAPNGVMGGATTHNNYPLFLRDTPKLDKELVDKLKSAMMLAYGRSFKVEGEPALEFRLPAPVSPLILVAVFDRDDFAKHHNGDDITVTAQRVFYEKPPTPGQKGAAKTLLGADDVRVIDRRYFKLADHTITHPMVPTQQLIYGEVSLDDGTVVTLEAVQALKRLHALSRELDQELARQGAKGKD